MKKSVVIKLSIIVTLFAVVVLIAGIVFFHRNGAGTLSPASSSTVATGPGSAAWEGKCIYASDLQVVEKDPQNVCSLDLSSQDLTAIPSSVFAMTNLEYLNLANNNIASVPSDIGDLTRLKWLYLNQNPIVSLPDSINKLADLQLFSIGYDKIVAMPSNMAGMTNLREIVLRGNPLPAREVSRIKSILPNTKIVY
jgi:hypothetical protein